jgi:hypothetical protein
MMEYYGKKEFAIDVRLYEPAELATKVQQLLDDLTRQDIEASYRDFNNAHFRATERVGFAFDLLSQWLERALSDHSV